MAFLSSVKIKFDTHDDILNDGGRRSVLPSGGCGSYRECPFLTQSGHR
jgi:hypothetical protein